MVLSCPDGANYAAVAKQLHETALEAEGRIFELERTLRAAVNRPTLIQTSTALDGGIVANVDTRVGPASGDGAWVFTFDNTGLTPQENVDGTNLVERLGEGIYDFGAYFNFIPSVVVDDNSFRLLRILHNRPDPTAPSGIRLIDVAAYLIFEPSTGTGVDFSLVGTFRMIPGDYVDFVLSHGNTSSTMDSQIEAIVWMHKLSDASVLAVI